MLERMTFYAYGHQWLSDSQGKVLVEFTPATAQQLKENLEAYLAANKEPCGECHLQPNETCDICGVTAPSKDD